MTSLTVRRSEWGVEDQRRLVSIRTSLVIHHNRQLWDEVPYILALVVNLQACVI